MITGKKAMEYAECPVCFDHLAKHPVSVFMANQRRTCRHFFHTACTHALMEADQMQCPSCRAPFAASLEVPHINADPRAWFSCVDFDGNGKLDQQEVLEVLKATLLLDYREIERQFSAKFGQWDTDGNGYVTYNEMMNPGGIVEYARRFSSVPVREGPPDIRVDRVAWFRYWDDDSSGQLDMEEILRAFIKTFRLENTVQQAIGLRGILECLWFEIDPDGSGGVDLHEFNKRDGLADMILANLGL
eukprot:GEMP01041020.1.p1 GENE.GEMP01041020.1~~GEMP01041020.1.p1  ORF type:complete len:245 (+),score=36.31 GEMP01041020.1:64-798(+)